MKAKFSPGFARVCLWAALLGATTYAWAETATPPTAAEERLWRVWTSSDGRQIEAYLQGVTDGHVVIVRRDGQQFVAPLERFSVEDRQFVAQQVQLNLPTPEQFAAVDFTEIELPDQFSIEGVEHIRRRAQDPIGAAALRMALRFHRVETPENFEDMIQAIAPDRDELVPPADLQNVLHGLTVRSAIIDGGRPGVAGVPLDAERWEGNREALRTALTWGLPVVMFYLPRPDIDLIPAAVVMTGYNRQRFDFLDPDGGRSPASIHEQDLEFLFLYGLVLFPEAESIAPVAPGPPVLSREFLSGVSDAIRQAPEFSSEMVAETLQQAGHEVNFRDVNRMELRQSLGQTRSFARDGGVTFVEASLRAGNVAILPQEHQRDAPPSFLLIYGQAGGQFQVVEFLPDRQFVRQNIEPAEVARRWITRVERTYRLDLIEVSAPRALETEEAATYGGRPGAQPEP